jgi:hypothetical protein
MIYNWGEGTTFYTSFDLFELPHEWREFCKEWGELKLIWDEWLYLVESTPTRLKSFIRDIISVPQIQFIPDKDDGSRIPRQGGLACKQYIHMGNEGENWNWSCTYTFTPKDRIVGSQYVVILSNETGASTE